MKGEIFLVAG